MESRYTAYRNRKRTKGLKEVLLTLPADLVVQIDAIQETRGFSSRSDTVAALINEGKAVLMT